MSIDNNFEPDNWPLCIRADAAATVDRARAKARKMALIIALIAFLAIISLTACGRADDAAGAVPLSAPSDLTAQTGIREHFSSLDSSLWQRGYCWFERRGIREIRDVDGGLPLLLLYRGEYPPASQCPTG